MFHLESPSPKTPLGAKGVGEAGTIGSYGAVANAIADALEPFAVSITELPLQLDYLWRKINEEKQGAAATVAG